MTASYTVVVNPAAGSGRAMRVLPRAVQGLVAALTDARVVVHVGSSEADTTEAMRRAVAGSSEGDALIVIGGDGTVHAGLNACAGTPVPLGIVPAGTGNDFCRGAGLPRRPDAAIAAIGEGRVATIDLMHLAEVDAEHRWAGSVLSTGFDELVNHRVNRMTHRGGPLTYAAAALAELRTFRPLHYTLTVDDDEPRRLDAMLIAVANAGVFGGGMRICPDADVTDGLLGVTIIHPVGRGTLLRLLPRTFDGSFVSHPAVERFRARRVRVEGHGLFGMTDGERVGRTPLTCTAVPGALRLLGR